jgi:hypothetical protein
MAKYWMTRHCDFIEVCIVEAPDTDCARAMYHLNTVDDAFSYRKGGHELLDAVEIPESECGDAGYTVVPLTPELLAEFESEYYDDDAFELANRMRAQLGMEPLVDPDDEMGELLGGDVMLADGEIVTAAELRQREIEDEEEVSQ